MPLIEASSYCPPPLLRNAHVNTILPVLRRVEGVRCRRARLETPDGDFLDLDWAEVGARQVAVVSHGLEGSSRRSYMLGMARALNARGWDALLWNYRGCSGEPNRLLRSYHSGATEDLDVVLRHVLQHRRYERVALIGFSLGGNLTLKYLGEREGDVDDRVYRAVAFSVPCDLAAGAERMAMPANRFYTARFLRLLRAKVRAKMEVLPGCLDDAGIETLRTFHDFDGRYTAPIHGFESAEDYWRRCSSKRFLRGIRIPTLVVNALDDPFLPDACYPVAEARANGCLFLEQPAYGGHIGFVTLGEEYWSETRALAFLEAARD